MEIMQSILKRSSVRGYQPGQITPEELEQILYAGCAAPVGMSKYDSVHITVVQDPKLLAQLSETGKGIIKITSDPLYGAPTMILLSCGEGAPGLDYVNASCIGENMMLQAAHDGIGSVIVWCAALAAQFNPELKAQLRIPEGFKPVLAMVFGYPAKESAQKEPKLTIQIDRL